jgi:hypothetical protein
LHRRSVVRRSFLLLAVCLLLGTQSCAGPAAAADAKFAPLIELKTLVPGGGGRNWADLTALVFPGVKSELEIRRAAEAAAPETVFNEPVYLPERRIAEAITPLHPLSARFKMPEKMPKRYFIDGVKFVRITGDGKPILAALFGGNSDGIAVLALFEAGPQGRLLDLVNVRSDRSTTLIELPALPLVPKATVFVLVNSHESHTVTYEEDTLVYVRDGRFAEIGGFSMSGSHLDCSEELNRTAVFRARPGADKTHARIEALITTTQTTRPRDCEKRRYKPVLETTKDIASWRWNPLTQAHDAHVPEGSKLGAWEGAPD